MLICVSIWVRTEPVQYDVSRETSRFCRVGGFFFTWNGRKYSRIQGDKVNKPRKRERIELNDVYLYSLYPCQSLLTYISVETKGALHG